MDQSPDVVAFLSHPAIASPSKKRKLTPDVVRLIRKLRTEERRSFRDLAAGAGCSTGLIQRILDGTAYRDVA
jgi:hypothetical protein